MRPRSSRLLLRTMTADLHNDVDVDWRLVVRGFATYVAPVPAASPTRRPQLRTRHYIRRSEVNSLIVRPGRRSSSDVVAAGRAPGVLALGWARETKD